MKERIVVDGISIEEIESDHPIRLFDTKTFKAIPFEGKGYMPSISSDNKYLISSADGYVYRFNLERKNAPDTLYGALPQFSDNNGIMFTSKNGSTFLDVDLLQEISFQGGMLLVSPDTRACVTQGTTQIGYWDMTGDIINTYDFGRNIISSKYFISDSILLVITEGYGALVNEKFELSNGKSQPVYWLINLVEKSIVKKKSIDGRLLGISEDKKELFIDNGDIKVISTTDLECTSELYLSNRWSHGEQFPLQISNDKSKILYLNKDNQLMIHENVGLNSLIKQYRSKFHDMEMATYWKQRYYLE